MLIINLNKFGGLSRDDRRLLFQAVLLLPVIHFALLLLGYHHLRRLIEKLTPLRVMHTPVSEAKTLRRAGEIARVVSIAAEHGFFHATCLRRSLLVWWLLRREDIQSEICFGVRMIDHNFGAHAWVEYHGSVVNDSADVHEHYNTLYDVLPPTKSGL